MSLRSATAIDRASCLALLASRSLGRLIFTRQALPEVLPVNYRLDGENVLLRLAFGSAAATASASQGAVVAFEADDFDPLGLTGWSVTVVGRAREHTDPDERLRASMVDLRSWSVDGRDRFFSVAVERITGQRMYLSSI